MAATASFERHEAPPRVRVLVVDDQPMFAELVAQVLAAESDFEVVGTAGGGDAARAQASLHRPDVVVMDYRMPGADGIAVSQALRNDDPRIQVIILTGHDDQGVMRSALSAGCAGFVTKDRTTSDLVDAVRSVNGGQVAITAANAVSLASAPASSGTNLSHGLTERELEVLRGLADGASSRQLAEHLFISLNTARNHVQRVIAKLGAHSRLEAVAIAYRTGILEANTPDR